jgi:hypothetical protein
MEFEKEDIEQEFNKVESAIKKPSSGNKYFSW